MLPCAQRSSDAGNRSNTNHTCRTAASLRMQPQPHYRTAPTTHLHEQPAAGHPNLSHTRTHEFTHHHTHTTAATKNPLQQMQHLLQLNKGAAALCHINHETTACLLLLLATCFFS
jgi:hypothetical protein